MMKLSRLLSSSRNVMSKDLLNGSDVSLSRTFSSKAGVSTVEEKFGFKGEGGFAASYTVYKGKAALAVSPVLPTFSKLESGFSVVNRKGVMMLKFIPAIGERKYDWEKKQMFALSPTEVGSIISLGSNEGCEFFHDPSMLSSNAGQVRKSLSIKPHSTGGGYMITLTVVNNIQKTRESISVPFTIAEFAVVKTACSYALPHLLGWDKVTKGPSDAQGRRTSSPPKLDKRLLDTEWDK